MEQKIKLQEWKRLLNREPDPKELEPTPDGRAKTLPISFIEMTLDELFEDWGTRNFTTKVIGNEVCGELELWAINPVTGREITRVGAAAIVIQVDKVPEGLDGQERNRWALNPDNKKPNALDLGYPKLKAECVKNAALSLGKIFGRDINRQKSDVFNPMLKPLSDEGFKALVNRLQSGDNQALAKAEMYFIFTEEQQQILESLKQKKFLS
jgi:hypothetical protein